MKYLSGNTGNNFENMAVITNFNGLSSFLINIKSKIFFQTSLKMRKHWQFPMCFVHLDFYESGYIPLSDTDAMICTYIFCGMHIQDFIPFKSMTSLSKDNIS